MSELKRQVLLAAYNGALAADMSINAVFHGDFQITSHHLLATVDAALQSRIPLLCPTEAHDRNGNTLIALTAAGRAELDRLMGGA